MFMDTGNQPQISSWPALQADETLLWEGRPAPRCYTFRRWKHALFGAVLTLLCTVWLWMGVEQAAATGWSWLVLVPLPFLLYALWLAVGRLLAARLEWGNVACAVTDRRIIVRGGLLKVRETELLLAHVTWFRLQPHGEELGTLTARGGEGDPVLVLPCLEYPRRPAVLLEAAIKMNSGER